ncbi:LamG domain-containing protein [Sunxiuqinia dokdonensis]|nr:LamG domain-containing protein [Sunxiuqinia dokdonensis]
MASLTEASMLDELRLFNKTLTQEEVEAIMGN